MNRSGENPQINFVRFLFRETFANSSEKVIGLLDSRGFQQSKSGVSIVTWWVWNSAGYYFRKRSFGYHERGKYDWIYQHPLRFLYNEKCLKSLLFRRDILERQQSDSSTIFLYWMRNSDFLQKVDRGGEQNKNKSHWNSRYASFMKILHKSKIKSIGSYLVCKKWKCAVTQWFAAAYEICMLSSSSSNNTNNNNRYLPFYSKRNLLLIDAGVATGFFIVYVTRTVSIQQ